MKYSTGGNVSLLDFRVRNGNGYFQAALTVHKLLDIAGVYKDCDF
jgi:hypothetical protein